MRFEEADIFAYEESPDRVFMVYLEEKTEDKPQEQSVQSIVQSE